MQNKPKAELTAALMLLDTRSMSFDMREIDNRRFMFSPQAGELILGRQYRGGQLYKSHAEEHFDSGAKAPFDSFIRGWIGTGRDYPDGVIHFAPNIGTDNITAFDNAFSTLQMFSENRRARLWAKVGAAAKRHYHTNKRKEQNRERTGKELFQL